MAIKSEAAKERKRALRRKYNAKPSNIAKRSENNSARKRLGLKKGSGTVADHVKGNKAGVKGPVKKQSARASAVQGGKKISRNKAHMARIGRKGGKSKG